MGLTRDTATLMVGQYFKRRREVVEIALVGSSGIGLAVMTIFLHTTLTYVWHDPTKWKRLMTVGPLPCTSLSLQGYRMASGTSSCHRSGVGHLPARFVL